ncbi:hypothetical protein E4U41_003577 [Claviceps citrina]|nr:hypothetical protein E4U41_003577 [Claviceps citrina]
MPLLNNRNSRARGRIVGLSNRQRAPHLLSNFQATTSAKPPIRKLKVPKAYDDPPVSSDEEDSRLNIQTPISSPGSARKKSCTFKTTSSETPSKKRSEVTGLPRPHADESSSGDELATRGDIQSTVFTKEKRSEELRWKDRRKREVSTPEPSQETDPPLSKKQRKGEYVSAERGDDAGPTAPTSSGEHFTNGLGFTKTKKSKMTYKKRVNSSQEQAPKKDEGQKPRRKIKIPEVIPDSSFPSSPEKTKAKKLMVPPEAVESSPPPKVSKKLLLVPDDEDIFDKASFKDPKSIQSSQGSNHSEGERRKFQKKKLESDPTLLPPRRARLKIPTSPNKLESHATSNTEADQSLSIDLSETDDTVAEELDSRGRSQDQVAADVAKPAAVCPWCGEEVDANLLQEFSKGKRLNVSLQTKFCQKHKMKTAGEVWQQKEYPRVEWDGLERRFALHSSWLLDIINGRPSHYRSIHEKNIESGKGRSMKKEGNMNPGYYGPRGFNVMCDYLVEEFGNLLKKKAVDDKVIAGRGSASFIQNVLVAELAVQMIREDMHVSEDEAIAILEDSKALGELIHEEV